MISFCSNRYAIASAWAVVAIVSACSRATAVKGTPEVPAPLAEREIRTDSAAIAKARADSVTRPYTDADVHFVAAMIPHHTQAITMSRWAETHGASQAVRTLAGRNINAQQDEIVNMKQWLADRQKLHSSSHTVHHMPGMLTEAQLEQLDAARGVEFDRLFLTFMIQHHKGAVEMVSQLFRTQGAAQDLFVFKLANDVNVDQSTEIARMEQMLANLPK